LRDVPAHLAVSHTFLAHVRTPRPRAVTCPLSEAQAHGLLDDELAADESAAVRRHVDGCARCRAHVARLSHLLAALRRQRLRREPAPASLRDRVHALARAE
jgi:anti-sigma factor RsiW